MTFSQIVTTICRFCNLNSDEATERVGGSVNRHHRRVTSTLGMNATRHVTRSVSMTVGQPYVTFTNIEKIDRILDTTDSSNVRLVHETTLDTQRTTQPGTSEPNTWALRDALATSVTVLTDTVPQTAYSLQADGVATLSDLTGDDQPVFAESFHDILTFNVIAEELLKKEKVALAREFASGDEERPGRAEILLKQLRFHLADSPSLSITSGGATSQSPRAAAGGGGGSVGGTSYTQTALVTFDRGAGLAPFAVGQATAATVPNLDADKLDGEDGTFYLDLGNATGVVPAHAARHENAGADELSVNGLSGLLADAQTPLAHQTSHQQGGTDALKLDDLASPDDTTDLDATTGHHGLLRKLSNSATSYLDGQGNWTTPSVAQGSTTQVQYNASGSLAGDADFTFDASTNTLAIPRVAFPATQSASTGANVLDDYEEGTWTPTDASGAGLSLTSTEGSYVKIGQLVLVAFNVRYPSTASGVGAVIGGFPFTAQNSTNNLFGGLCRGGGSSQIMAQMVKNTTTAQMINQASGSQYVNSDLSSGVFNGSFVYRATA